MSQKDINPFKYSDTNKRYHTYDRFLKSKFGFKCAKLSLDGGFTCPNIDGTKGVGGCVYCSALGSGEFTASGSITEQAETQKKVYMRKWNGRRLGYIAYFQAHTNTYAPVDVLSRIYGEALACEGVVGMSIATRADALPDDVCRLLYEISQRTFLTVELGLQSCHEVTAERINRCHTLAEFESAVNKLRDLGIRVCVHLINGLPGEDEEMMIQSAKYVSSLDIQGVKIHSLSVLSDSRLGQMYRERPFYIMSREEYIRTAVSQLRVMRGDIVIERLTGDPEPGKLIVPDWSLDKISVLNGIDKLMYALDTYQGADISDA